MMKKIKYLVLFSFLLLAPNIVKAYGCDVNEFSRLQKLASNIATSYTYTESFDSSGIGHAIFTVKISNLNREFYLENYTSKEIYGYVDSEMIFYNQTPGKKITLTVYGNNEQCVGKRINNLYINLPSYNAYYKDKICTGYEDYDLCQKWYKTDYSYDEFKEAMNKYINIKKQENQDEEEKTDEFALFFLIMNYLNKYYLYVLPPIIAVSAIWIIILKIKKKRNEFDLKLKN